MRIPEKVRIGGIDYPIRYVESLNDGAYVAYGQIDLDNPEIRISSTSGVEYQHQCITLWHEILHGLWDHFNLDSEHEEELVTTLAKGIYMVLEDNKELLSEDSDEQLS